MVCEGRIEVAARHVVDLGCGGGVVSLAAASMGARRVTANDTDPVALHVTGLNARACGLDTDVDCRDLTRDGAVAADVLFVADMFYEKRAAARTMALIEGSRSRGATVFLADGGRPFVPHGLGPEMLRTDVAVDDDLEGLPVRTVRVWRLDP
jgi:predicted nicotinamide N-methyase